MVRMRLEQISIEEVESDETGKYGKFVITPLMRGYGTTLGTALRRSLLSYVQGPAFTYVDIRVLEEKRGGETVSTQILHEFTTIPKVLETAMELILNLRSLPIRIRSADPKRIFIDAKGYKEVRGADVIPDLEMEILDPEHYICTVEKGATLKIEAGCMLGRGYVPAEEHWPGDLRPEWKHLESFPPGIIPIDSDFSPVKKVAVNVEQTRVERSTDYEKLTLEIWTNGSVAPSEALGEAADVLWNYFSVIRGHYAPLSEIVSTPYRLPPTRAKQMSIEKLGFPKRVHNALIKREIRTVGDLIERTAEELAKIHGLGMETVRKIQEALDKIGLSLKSDGAEEEEWPSSGEFPLSPEEETKPRRRRGRKKKEEKEDET
ncbi:MAG: DNA-directed RNA polymerase subunit alpha [bacterium JZ-2024 1]